MLFIWRRVLLWLLVAAASFAAGPASAADPVPYKGRAELGDLCLAGCIARSVVVAYRLDAFFGEPVVDGTFKWEAGDGTDPDCLPGDTAIRVTIDGRWHHDIRPAVPRAGKGAGASMAGSPDWDEVLCDATGQCASPDAAKDYWRGLLKIRGTAPSVKWELVVQPSTPYDRKLTSTHRHASTDDGKELLHHLELMRSQREQGPAARVEWLAKELERTRGGCCGYDDLTRHRRVAFLLELLTETASRLPPAAERAYSCTTARKRPKRQDDIDVSDLEALKDDLVLGHLMRALISVAPSACLAGSIPGSASCGYELGQTLFAPKTGPLSAVPALQKRSCELTVVPRILEHPGGGRGKFWMSVYKRYCEPL